MSEKCPVCSTDIPDPIASFVNEGELKSFSCPRCGDFKLDKNVLHPDVLRGKLLKGDIIKVAKLSHWIRTRHEALIKEGPDEQYFRKTTLLDDESVRAVLAEDLTEAIMSNPRPSLVEQADNYLRWIGDNVKVAGHYTEVQELAIQAIVGSATVEEFELVSSHLRDRGLIVHKSETGVWRKVSLTFAGWERYDELKRATSDSRKAFMAMQYGEEQLDTVVEDVFKPAVRETGFDLFRLVDRPQPAGLIDDRLRVEIRTSRFLIADLTHENRGAYWEAGYAEGLGKPVIYTCEERKFEKLTTHFDTNHHLTIKWDASDAEKLKHTADELKATIRATLPGDAKLTDE